MHICDSEECFCEEGACSCPRSSLAEKRRGTYEGGFDNALNALGSHLGVNGDERTSWYYTWSATSNKVAGQAGVRHVAIMIYSAESAAALCQSSAQPGTPYHAY